MPSTGGTGPGSSDVDGSGGNGNSGAGGPAGFGDAISNPEIGGTNANVATNTAGGGLDLAFNPQAPNTPEAVAAAQAQVDAFNNSLMGQLAGLLGVNQQLSFASDLTPGVDTNISLNPIGVVAGLLTGNPIIGAAVGKIAGTMAPGTQLNFGANLSNANMAGQPDGQNDPTLAADFGGGGGTLDETKPKTAEAKAKKQKEASKPSGPILDEFTKQFNFFKMPEFNILANGFDTMGGKAMDVSSAKSLLEQIIQENNSFVRG